MDFNILWQNTKEGKYNLYLVIGLGILLFIPFLGSVGLHDPWETHYGEVARSMLTRNDYIFPYWESGYFFSKPVFLMWMMAAGMHIFGVNEWGVRFFVAVLSILCMAITYWGVSRLINKRVGLLTTFVMATSPFYLFLSKQAITDMPYVGNMTIGMVFLALGLIERDESLPGLRSRITLTIVTLLATISQYALMINSGHMMKGLTQAAIVLIFAGLLAGYFAFTRKKQYEIFLFYGYIFMGFATLAKGVGGFAIPGAIWLLYILITGDWGILRRAMLPIGVFVFGIIALPWYVTLLSFNGRDTEGFTFYGRFFVHDHFNRLASGVHGDRGSFEYFIQQLGFGMFPWSAIIPFAYVGILKDKILDSAKELRTMLLYTIWGV
ncbi:MAG: glycosyltransferase family 39 protein, partial [Deltaproteobacteria bacterium]|nr:glycosyltransferase family 39 protein [Deltaproteobacteria bacterium]